MPLMAAIVGFGVVRLIGAALYDRLSAFDRSRCSTSDKSGLMRNALSPAPVMPITRTSSSAVAPPVADRKRCERNCVQFVRADRDQRERTPHGIKEVVEFRAPWGLGEWAPS